MKARFIGIWNLVYYKIVKEDGTLFSRPYGEGVKGNIIYTKEGRMNALLMNPDRPKFAIPHTWKGTPEEMKQAFRGYTSYSGKFDIIKNTVVHQVDMCLFPNWIGADLVRTFEFSTDGRELLLSTEPFDTGKGYTLQHVLLWDKIIA